MRVQRFRSNETRWSLLGSGAARLPSLCCPSRQQQACRNAAMHDQVCLEAANSFSQHGFADDHERALAQLQKQAVDDILFDESRRQEPRDLLLGFWAERIRFKRSRRLLRPQAPWKRRRSRDCGPQKIEDQGAADEARSQSRHGNELHRDWSQGPREIESSLEDVHPSAFSTVSAIRSPFVPMRQPRARVPARWRWKRARRPPGEADR